MAKAIGIVVLGTLAVSIPAALVAALVAGNLELEKDPTALTIVLSAGLFLELFLLSSAAYFSVRKYGAAWGELGLRAPRRGGYWLPGVLVFIALFVVYSYFALLAVFGIEPDSDIPKEAFNNTGPVTILAVLSLGFAPLMEEVFYRGFIFGGLRGRWGTPLAVLASGLLFGLSHVGNAGSLYVIVPTGLAGAVFACGYAYSGSLTAPIIAHFLFNFFAFSIGLATA